MDSFKIIGCVADYSSKQALASYNRLLEHYRLIDLKANPDSQCDAVVTIGGDGTMLRAMHKYLGTNTKLFGMNLGSKGFLLNKYQEDGLLERMACATETILHPLEIKIIDTKGCTHTTLAINEIAISRACHQAAHIRIIVDGEERMPELVADGVLLATPTGSTAYNLAAQGPIIPLDSNMLALTPICPFHPLRWRGALLSQKNRVRFESTSPEKRPITATADDMQYHNVVAVEVQHCSKLAVSLLFDSSNTFSARVIKEQFDY